MSDALRALLESGDFSEQQLAQWRASAVAHGGGGPPPGPETVMLAIGHVEIWDERHDKHTEHNLLVEGRELRLPSRKLYAAISNFAPYRVYFSGKTFLGLEPASPDEVPDAVAEAARAVGLDPTDPAVRTDERVAGILRTQLIVALGRAEEFTGEDLAVNRTGRLTLREQKRLRGESIGCFVAANFFATIAIVVVWASRSDGSSWLGWGCGLGGAALVAMLVAGGVNRRRDASGNRVVSMLATVEATSRPYLKAEDGRSFALERSAFSVRGFHPERLRALSYRVYAAPRSDELMSVEPGPDLSPLFG